MAGGAITAAEVYFFDDNGGVRLPAGKWLGQAMV